MIHIECQTIKEFNITLGALTECNLPYTIVETKHMADPKNAGEIIVGNVKAIKYKTEKIVVLVPRIVARA